MKSGSTVSLCKPFNLFIFVVYSICAMLLGSYMSYWCEYAEVTEYFTGNQQYNAKQLKNGNCQLKPINRGYLIIGIITNNANQTLRRTIRQTWMDINPTDLPFHVQYKFIVDKHTEELDRENLLYRDIVFLNSSYPLSSSRRLLLWLKYVAKKFQNVTLVAKIEHDVFLCTPQIYHRIQQIHTQKLLYGRKNTNNVIENVFFVLGRVLVERIASRDFCTGKSCGTNSLVEKATDGESLTEWVKAYDDVDINWETSKFATSKHQDNSSLSFSKYVTKSFCEEHLLYHSASMAVLKKLWSFNKFAGRIDVDLGATSSVVFSGDVIREIRPVNVELRPVAVSDRNFSVSCKQWGVTTTIFNASLSVRNMVNRPDWCVVIVADTKSQPQQTYLNNLGNKYDKRHVVYLEPADQDKLFPLLSKSIAWKTFGRKNIGYIYAMTHGAEVIWDFDDDNDGVVDTSILKKDGALAVSMPCEPYKNNKLNPYPYFGVKEAYPWPRGFPLEDILNNSYVPRFCKFISEDLNIGIIQSLANIQPDVDAVYRFVRQTPFNFKSTVANTLPVVLPRFAYSPLNAQATLWTSKAFRYMFLPVSINGRVSDIWRSYFAEYFLFKQEKDILFAPPYVNQFRNQHNLLGDFNAENDLYQKSHALIQHLSEANYENLTDLYLNMYRRGYINIKDIGLIKAWIQTLDYLNIP